MDGGFSIGRTIMENPPMCTTCLIEDVKRHMLSRRGLFTTAAATAAMGAAAGVLSARPALAQATGRVMDLDLCL